MSQNSQYEQMIRNMPPGLDRALLRILEYHKGKLAAIGGQDLTERVPSAGFLTDQRSVREAIKELRRAGHLICSTPGTAGGDYLAIDAAEFDEFAGQEFEAKIADMAETLKAMRQAAKEKFGQGVQRRLF